MRREEWEAAPERGALRTGSDEASCTKAGGEAVAGPLRLRVVHKPFQKEEHDDRGRKHRCRVHQPKQQRRENVCCPSAVDTRTKA